MKRFTTRPIVLVLLAAIAVATLAIWRTSRSPTGAELLADRMWLDHIPRNDRDTVQVFAAISEQHVGVFGATSSWRGGYELFRYESTADRLRIVYPQTRDRETAAFTARHCSDGGMDFCLEISGASRGVKRYYSQKGWEIDSHASREAALQQLDALRTRLTSGQ